MIDINRPRSYARTYIWAVLLGIVGFYFGANGQFLLLEKQASLAPLLGFIFTGPVGLFLGILLGELSSRYRLRAGENLLFLTIAVVFVGGGSLYMTVAEFDPTIRLVEAEISGCEKIDKLLASQAKYWSEGDAANPRPKARPN